MKALQWTMLIGLVAGLSLFNNLSAHAGRQLKLNTKPTIKPAGIASDRLPDLTFKHNLVWSTLPKAGDVIGKSGKIKLVIVNNGETPSVASKMSVGIRAVSGHSRLPSSLNGLLHIPPLNPGQTVTLSWPQLSSEKWQAGTFQLEFRIDPNHTVKETNESNNHKQLELAIAPASTEIQKKIKIAKARKIAPKAASSAGPALSAVAILSPKPDSMLMAARTYTVKYLAANAESVDLHMLIYDVGSNGQQYDTFTVRTLFENSPPTGTYQLEINEDRVPQRHYDGYISGSTERYDGKVALRLRAVIEGKNVERITPLKVKIPRLHLKDPGQGTNLYRGLWYDISWSNIGHYLDKVTLSIALLGDLGLTNTLWSIEVPNTGRYHLRIPQDLEIPQWADRVWFLVEEKFDRNIWDARVRSGTTVNVK